jgi:hypothetical protein
VDTGDLSGFGTRYSFKNEGEVNPIPEEKKKISGFKGRISKAFE